MSFDANLPARRSRRTRTLLSCAAAAVIVLGVGGDGLAAALAAGGHRAIPAFPPLSRLCPSPSSTSSSGSSGAYVASGSSVSSGTWCEVLYLGAGALMQTAGQTLTLVSARGYTTTVTTSAATAFLRVQAGNPGDITDGAQVRVTVASSGGALTATTVMISPEVTAIGSDPVQGDIVYGRVTDASAVGFTLVRPGLSSDRVTITPATTVIMPVRIRESQLRLNVATIAMGGPGAGGALAANTVEQFAVPAAIPPFYTSE